MNMKHKPSFLIPVANLIVMFFVIIGLALSISCASVTLRIIMIICQSLVIVLTVFQCILYLKNYIDYRSNEAELGK